eukprot:CAMPEP_0118710902 /NCGR_PEP_ID=MMETSP0800-20121206/23704_1 /TAXON_ID=210618 ORGANISM="Striatella unipunctata, Strain CCMP2910" /NCGR_SAMPLE_ID=MMETSP0800 /ASSEMBLY_ACC=CAM_ASM_000638 /LENGTH=537 /DNA_ID=CAMNT_0006615265 /DNA_START=312 /DNA_END=1928 /DNA_ORIENTATION=+
MSFMAPERNPAVTLEGNTATETKTKEISLKSGGKVPQFDNQTYVSSNLKTAAYVKHIHNETSIAFVNLQTTALSDDGAYTNQVHNETSIAHAGSLTNSTLSETQTSFSSVPDLNYTSATSIIPGSSENGGDDNDEEDMPVRTERGGFSHTKRSRAKISAANKGKTPWNKGVAASEERRRKISEGVRRKNRERLLQKLADQGITEEEYNAKKKEEKRLKAAAMNARRTKKGGVRPTEETKKKISAVLKAKWANGEMPKRRAPEKIRSNFTHSEETKRKISESVKRLWQDKEYRTSMIKAITEQNQGEAVRQRISESLKKRWQDPGFREYMMTKIQGRKPSNSTQVYGDEHRQRISEAMKLKWQDPSYRARALAATERRRQEYLRLYGNRPKARKRGPKGGEIVYIVDRETGERKKMVKKKKKRKMKRKEGNRKSKKLVEEGSVPVEDIDLNILANERIMNKFRTERGDLYNLLYGDDSHEEDEVKQKTEHILEQQLFESQEEELSAIEMLLQEGENEDLFDGDDDGMEVKGFNNMPFF